MGKLNIAIHEAPIFAAVGINFTFFGEIKSV
jgi:hypothetical protein